MLKAARKFQVTCLNKSYPPKTIGSLLSKFKLFVKNLYANRFSNCWNHIVVRSCKIKW